MIRHEIRPLAEELALTGMQIDMKLIKAVAQAKPSATSTQAPYGPPRSELGRALAQQGVSMAELLKLSGRRK